MSGQISASPAELLELAVILPVLNARAAFLLACAGSPPSSRQRAEPCLRMGFVSSMLRPEL